MELDRLRSPFNKHVASLEGSPEGGFLPKGAVPQAGLEYVRRLRDVRYYEAISEVLAKRLELAKLDEVREGAFIQVVDPAITPEKRSYPMRGLLVISGLAVGFTFGIMLALLQGGLIRMQQNAAGKDKLDLLRRSLWSGKSAKATVKAKNADEEEAEELRTLRHAPEATGSRF